MNLNRKFIIPINGVIFISVLATMGALILSSRMLLEKEINKEIDAQVTSLTNSVDYWFGVNNNNIKIWREIDAFETMLSTPTIPEKRKAANELLAIINRENLAYRSINIMDTEGTIIASSVPERRPEKRIKNGKKPINYKDREYFIQALRGTHYISEVLMGSSTNRPFIAIASPITYEGKVVGIINGIVDIHNFNSTYIDPVKVGEKGYAFLLDQRGMTISHPVKDLILKYNPAEEHDFAKAMVKNTAGGVEYYKWDGEKKMVTYRHVPSSKWIVGISLSIKEVYSSISRMRIIGFTGLILSLLFTVLTIRFLVTKILVGISDITEASKELAKGNLTREVTFTSDDEIGIMADAFRQMSSNLTEKSRVAEVISTGDMTPHVPVASDEDILGKSLQTMITNTVEVLLDIQDVAVEVNNGSAHVSDLSEALSSGAMESASAIENISNSMTTVGEMVTENAETAQQVSQMMVDAQKAIHSGTNEMKTLEAAMQKIAGSSEEIAKIIKVIDDIAFQTNLLALNAAVEAARAGAHGKGFAVVADEVRNLAGRSAKAAKETAVLIEEAVNNAEEGNMITDNTVKVFHIIEESVSQVSEMVHKIDEFSARQSTEVGHIVQGITEIESGIQHNTASAEETASSAAELSAMSTQLQKALARFTMDNSSYRKRIGNE